MTARHTAILFILALLAALVGCRPNSTTTGGTGGGSGTGVVGPSGEPIPEMTAQPINELTMALDSLRQMKATNGEQAGSRTRFYLNQWLGRQNTSDPWSPDPMIDTVASSLKPAIAMVQLERLSFDEDDLEYLQQGLWMRDVAEQTRLDPPPESLTPWIKKLGEAKGDLAAERISAAERLFDWTIRNIQLDELPPPPKAPEAQVGGDPAANTPPYRGEVGPGYGHVPWQTLLYGHGDAWERSRAFLLLARQAGIDGAMLAIADPQSAGNSQPWCVALLIEDELYLFDAELGLPIPGPGGEGIVTLKQLTDDPQLLRALDVKDGPSYRIKADDLKRIVALIDAEPRALTRRMELLEQGMPGSRRIALSIRPSNLQKKLRAQKQIGQISLWRVPLEAQIYQIGQKIRITQDPEAFAAWNREAGMFTSQHPLLRARDLHFQGVYTSVNQADGARPLYLSVRPSDREIERMATSTALRERMGLNAALPEDPAQRSAMLENLVAMSRRGKQHATHWLALTYYEDGNYPTAIDWLDKWVLNVSPRSPWMASARYNLARANEQLGNYEEALKLLRADDSPQRHGNLLRAQMLAERVSSDKEASAKAEETKPEDSKTEDSKPEKTESTSSDAKTATEDGATSDEAKP